MFKSKKLFKSNNASKETKFNEEIDNLSSCTDVKNFMIGPVFGTKNKDIPCAIIQFINKVEAPNALKNQEKGVTETEVTKFKQMQNLLGMCVENTNEMANTITTSFNVQDVMKNIEQMMEEEKARSNSNDQEQLFSDFKENRETIIKKIDELEKIRSTKVEKFEHK